MIKKILWAAAISATMALPAFAVEIDDSDCRFVMDLSKTVMESRQIGMSATTMTDVLVNNSDDHKFKGLIMKMIIRAYDAPKYSSAEYQQEAASEFANGYYLDCMKTLIK